MKEQHIILDILPETMRTFLQQDIAGAQIDDITMAAIVPLPSC